MAVGLADHLWTLRDEGISPQGSQLSAPPDASNLGLFLSGTLQKGEAMSQPFDEEREQRIEMEIITDANGPEEQALGWYTYLEENLQFPFLTRCINEQAISPLRVGDEVEVIGLGP
jgi:hypothetical protein